MKFEFSPHILEK